MLRKFQDQDSYVCIYIWDDCRTATEDVTAVLLWQEQYWSMATWPMRRRWMEIDRKGFANFLWNVQSWHGEVAWWSPRQLDEMASALQPWSAVYVHPLIQFANSMYLPQTQELTYFKAKKTHTTGHTNSVFQRSNPHMNQFSEVNPVLQCFQRSNFHINPHLWTGQFLYFSRTKPAVPLRRSPSAQRPCGGEGLRRDLLAFYVTWH